VKVSDELVLDARVTGETLKRSIAGQIEFWAKLGRALERLIDGESALALSRSGAARPLSAVLKEVDTPKGRERVFCYLKQQPYPHYETDPKLPQLLIKIEAGGKRTRGRFVNRKFAPLTQNAK
jgi:hypothetical protein